MSIPMLKSLELAAHEERMAATLRTYTKMLEELPSYIKAAVEEKDAHEALVAKMVQETKPIELGRSNDSIKFAMTATFNLAISPRIKNITQRQAVLDAFKDGKSVSLKEVEELVAAGMANGTVVQNPNKKHASTAFGIAKWHMREFYNDGMIAPMN